MCLKTIIREEILSEDLTVWKIVGYNTIDRHYYFGIYFNPKRIKKGVNKTIIKNIYTYSNIKYNSGYHCYLLEKDAKDIHENFYNYPQRKVRKFVIPKGTKVTYGKQIYNNNNNEFETETIVIVTPILIN